MGINASTAFAQLDEVRGVETEWVQVAGQGNSNCNCRLTNRNSFTVSVDVELWEFTGTDLGDAVMQTKSFILEPGESFEWEIQKKAKDGHFVTYRAFRLE